jgi:hypothetical protein
LDRWQEQSYQDTDDGDNDQEFHKGKTGSVAASGQRG